MYLMVLSLLMTVPIGVGAAIYLEEFAQPEPVHRGRRLSVESLVVRAVNRVRDLRRRHVAGRAGLRL